MDARATPKAPSGADLVLHPVRLRIIQQFLGGRELTTAEVAAGVGEVSTATVYRQMGVLADAGILVVVGVQQVRGAVERTYRLAVERAHLTAQDAAGMTASEHRAGFLAFVGSVVRTFDEYLERDDPDLGRDGVGYRQVPFYATDHEVATIALQIRGVLMPYVDTPGAGRTLRLLTTVLLPGDGPHQ
ncbi:helix-turn-helix domain-containing protein [Pengzhenrongella phosphoraccumulans]|uniref:helix-turn-helix domain-containing protein n=1 Tax=Pengzhenrongella phosphoraccumulans TaxID=3114394 RepID=UPI00388E84AB